MQENIPKKIKTTRISQGDLLKLLQNFNNKNPQNINPNIPNFKNTVFKDSCNIIKYSLLYSSKEKAAGL